MKITSGFIGFALLMGTTMAAPLTEKRRARQALRLLERGSRHGFSHKSNPPFKPGTREVMSTNPHNKNVDYSENWSGVVLVGSGYTEVTAQFTVPTPSEGSGNGGQEACASAWVGIDGDTCESAILQTGVDFCVQDGQVGYDAWYEWFPDYAYDFNGIDINAGDEIQVTVKASSKTSGTATVKNLSSGQSVSHQFSGQTSGQLCETNAEWIVEDFESNNSLVPFADFGTVQFSNAYAISNGNQVGPSGGDVVDIRQNGQVLTSVSVGGNSVTVRYV